MQVNAVIRKLIDHSGMSDRGVSAALGQSPAWARMAAHAKDTKLSTLARVADIASCDIVIVDRETGERLGVVEPPER